MAPAIAATGVGLEYLPPYSPDLNPMEPCWSRVKTRLRTAAARTREALDHALSEALMQVTPQDARRRLRLSGLGLALDHRPFYRGVLFCGWRDRHSVTPRTGAGASVGQTLTRMPRYLQRTGVPGCETSRR